VVKKQIDDITERDEAAKRHEKAIAELNGSHERLTDLLERLKNTIIETSIKEKLDSSDKETQDKAWQLIDLLMELIKEKTKGDKEVQEANREYLRLNIDEAELKELIKLKRQLDEEKAKKAKPYMSTFASKDALCLMNAMLSPKQPKIKNNKQLSQGVRASSKAIIQWDKGKPGIEGALLFVYAIGLYKETKTPEISIDLTEWQSLRGTKRRTTIDEIVSDLDKIYEASIFFDKSKARMLMKTPDTSKRQSTIIKFKLHDEIAKMFAESKAFMYIHKAIFTVNPKLNPHSIQLLLSISSHTALNTISKVPTSYLIRESCLPTEEEVKTKHQRHYKDKIIDPFERDMNALNKVFTWKYKSGSGASWKEFTDSIIEIRYIDPHPNHDKIDEPKQPKPKNKR